MAKGNEIPTVVREAITKRDGNQCVLCGAPARDSHHRAKRDMAGHRKSNVVRLCRTDHSWVHANPAEAKQMGLIVPWWDDTAAVPMQTWHGRVYLDDEGGFEYTLDEAGVAA